MSSIGIKMRESNYLLSLLDGFTMTNLNTVGQAIADDFRCRRIEKNMTRKMVSEMSKVALANITRFEQKGEISLHNLIRLAMALGYTSEIKGIFSEPKFSTMAELELIKRNMNKKKAYPNKKEDEKGK